MSRPTGTVTFLFSDIEGSTRRWERYPDAMPAALARHDATMRAAIESSGGYVFKALGDAFCAAFATARDAVGAALNGQRALLADDFSAVEGMYVRMALHTGFAEDRDGDYFGSAVNRVARLLAIGHGGQVLVSGTTADLLQDALPASSDLRDLGAHRLKDLARPERVHQLLASGLPDSFPALLSLEALPNNLPVQLTSFVGRDDAVAEIKEMLQSRHLVTLVGPGGVGKTRCAIQTGAELLDRFPDGVWLVELASISDPALVVVAIAQTLGVRETPGRSLLDTLTAHVGARRLLLVLDNCEHLIEMVRDVASAILRTCSNAGILATSRESLNVAGEQIVRLPSLAVPPQGEAAATLFIDRALAADPGFARTPDNERSIGDIVRRLDGIPLAIELAAARVKVLSPQQLAQRLDERFRILTGGDRSALPRQQTLRATIDWSFDLLDERERTFFRRLSIFSGGWTLPAAADVCGADEWEMLDALSSLVDKSLVVAEAGDGDRRYHMLYSIREYGLERLAEANESDATAERHGGYFARLVRDLQPLALSLEDVEWWQRLTPEIDNVRAAVEWTLFAGRQPAVGRALLADMEWPELVTTPNEALRWYEAALDADGDIGDALLHSRLIRHRVILEWLAGRSLEQRERTALRGVEVARRAGDANELARALANLGATYRTCGRFEEADRALAEAYVSPERLTRLTTNTVLRIWAVTDLQRGDVELARRRFSQIVGLERAGSDAHSSALLNLAELEFVAGNVEGARELAGRARDAYERLNSVYLALVLSNLAAYAMHAGDLEDARGHLRHALELQPRSGDAWIGNLLDNHALYAALLGDYERAALLAGFTETLYRSRGDVRQRTERAVYERLVALLEAGYAEPERARMAREGTALTEQQALAHAAAIVESTTILAAEPPKGEP